MAKNRVPLSSRLAMDTPSVTLPGSVAKAMQVSFGIQVTAYLSSVRFGPGELSLQGIVFGDRDRRFEDGASIVTSVVLTSEEQHGFVLVHTLWSVYVVCDWAGECAIVSREVV